MGLSDLLRTHRKVAERRPREPAQPVTGSRAFSPDDFCSSPSWDRLQGILDERRGGCFGLYGPCGSGKSWLMHKAVDYASDNKGMGLWFPSPSKYDANAFLSSLSDNLANSVERQFMRNDTFYNLITGARKFLIAIGAVLLAFAIVVYFDRRFGSQTNSSGKSITSLLPDWLWIMLWITAISVACLFLFLYAMQLAHNLTKSGRLLREAAILRERIRYAASLKSGTELGLGGDAKSFTASLKRSQEKALSERPTTIASLVFDFRSLAEAIVHVMKGPLVIGIDELDKLGDPAAAQELLRDIKGIFEIDGVHFLVSVSEEEAAALQLGTLREDKRNEISGSFYTIIELPPLDESSTKQLLATKGHRVDKDQAYALCLMSAGNQRELIRIAGATLGYDVGLSKGSEGQIISSTMKEESSALLTEIIRSSSASGSGSLSSGAKSSAWQALSPAYFESVDSFVSLGREAIVKYWDVPWVDQSWNSVSEPWRRLLVRLFVSASWLELCNNAHANCDSIVKRSTFTDLLKVMIMAGKDAGIAKLMLKDRLSGAMPAVACRHPQPDRPVPPDDFRSLVVLTPFNPTARVASPRTIANGSTAIYSRTRATKSEI